MAINNFLECQKQNVLTTVAIDNGRKKQNPDLATINVSDMYVSIFAADIRGELRYTASNCSTASSSASNETSAIRASNEVSGYAKDMNELIGWSSSAAEEISATEGVSQSAISSLGQTLSSSCQYASQVINNAAATVNASLERIKAAKSNQTEQSTESENTEQQVNKPEKINTEPQKLNDEELVQAENNIQEVNQAGDNISKQAEQYTKGSVEETPVNSSDTTTATAASTESTRNTTTTTASPAATTTESKTTAADTSGLSVVPKTSTEVLPPGLDTQPISTT